MRVVALLFLIPGIAASDNEWEAYKTNFARRYSSPDHEQARYWIFKENLAHISEHNAKTSSFRLGLNDFSDMTWAEFSETHFGLMESASDLSNSVAAYISPSEVTASSVDWVKKGVVTDVKNQGSCGSCWAFAGIASLESAWAIATGNLLSLSEQELLDCTIGHCSGGSVGALDFVETAGICSETSYPYKATEMSCSSSKCSPVIPAGGMTGLSILQDRTTSGLQSAVSTQPMYISVLADSDWFMYGGGVYYGNCLNERTTNHAVVAVGYGTYYSMDYWKIKNSWGAGWGESGYIRVQRGGSCAYGISGVLVAPYAIHVNRNAMETSVSV